MGGNAKFSAGLSDAEGREFIPFAHELIATAFSTIRPFFLGATPVLTKADATPVTQADRGAEEAMRALIEARYPGHGIFGEEFGVKETASDGTRYRWVIDPVDGTRAFISNCFLFGTLIALERDDGTGFRPVLGVIAHPAAGHALIGHAAACRLYRADGSERVVKVRPCANLGDATVLATTHWSTGEQPGGPAVETLIRRAKLYRTWGDCFGYFAVATGGADIMLDPSLSYWDVAAVVPVIEGAGGRVTSWSGGNPLEQPSLIASGGALHDEVLRCLNHPGPA
ncbi:MAG TPA: inositol monophosphatase family protein [Burkholderiaceae bacterium]|nr:inositol monophosphatase family protein [Burkholderiaceae bacterium]